MIQLLLLLKGAASYRVTAARDPNLTYETFLSPAISLKSGQIANTAADWPGDGKFLDFIKGPAAIRHFQASIVSDNDREVGLEEVYVHHWYLPWLLPLVFLPSLQTCLELHRFLAG